MSGIKKNKIKKLKKRIEKLEEDKKTIYYEIDSMIKHKFEEIGGAYDNLILKEANDLRNEWKQFEKQNSKLFKYKKHK
jgi:uncharacterized protein (UPF0335 family)